MRRSLLVASLLLLPSRALADETNVDRARVLAQEAGDLLDDKQYAEALERAKQAEALYHAPIHVFQIAQALEGLGRFAESVAAYEQLVAEPLPSTAPGVFRDAQVQGKQRLNALQARVPSILVRVHGVPAEDATATVGGRPFDVKAGVAMRLDPGEYVVEVTTPGRPTFKRSVTLPERGGVVVVDAGLQADAPSSSAAEAAPPVPAAADGDRPSAVPAIVAFGVGGAGLAVGAVAGVLFLGKLGDLKDRCPEDKCSAAEQDEIDSTGLLGHVSTIGFGVGAAGVATGVVLLVLRSGSKPQSSAARTARGTRAPTLAPWIDGRSAGVSGAF